MKPFLQIEAEKVRYSVAMMCRLLGVSRSGYYSQRRRPKSKRQQETATLVRDIKHYHAASLGTYGSPRILQDLKERGVKVGRHRVARLMRAHGISGNPLKRFRRTTDSTHTFPVADNVLNRKFTTDGPDKAWVTDITYLRTWEGWLYLAVVIDLYSRRVIGWSMDTSLDKSLPLRALHMALGRRLPSEGMLHHSDQGSQYASLDYRHALTKHGIVCSMSRKGNCWDNAVAESFFRTLKTELIYRGHWPTVAITKQAVVDYIEIFYNRKRRHSTIGYISPVELEKRFAMEAAKAA